MCGKEEGGKYRQGGADNTRGLHLHQKRPTTIPEVSLVGIQYEAGSILAMSRGRAKLVARTGAGLG